MKVADDSILEDRREIPVIKRVNVLVVGGGTAGAVAAVAAARTGAKTLVVDRQHWLGGHMTGGIDAWPYAYGDTRRVVAGSIAEEIVKRLDVMDGVDGDVKKDMEILIDCEALKYVLDQMVMEEDNLDVLYDCWFADAVIEDNQLKGIIIETKSARQAILADVVVDCSGDADVAARAGAPFVMEPRDKIMPVSVVAKLSNVDIEKLRRENPQTKPFPGLVKGYSYPGVRCWKPLEKYLQEEKQKGTLDPELEYLLDWFFYLGGTAKPGEMILIMTGEKEIHSTEVADITRALMISRKRLWESVALLRKYVPAFADSFLSATGILGVRESRLIIGEYVLTKEDILSCRHFDDVVARGVSPPGPHTPDGKDIAQPEQEHLKPPSSFEIPLRCLLPKKIDNLLVAGRCISVEHSGTGSIRVMGACMATGQAAGVAAAVASDQATAPRKVSASKVQSILEEQGVDLSP